MAERAVFEIQLTNAGGGAPPPPPPPGDIPPMPPPAPPMPPPVPAASPAYPGASGVHDAPTLLRPGPEVHEDNRRRIHEAETLFGDASAAVKGFAEQLFEAMLALGRLPGEVEGAAAPKGFTPGAEPPPPVTGVEHVPFVTSKDPAAAKALARMQADEDAEAKKRVDDQAQARYDQMRGKVPRATPADPADRDALAQMDAEYGARDRAERAKEARKGMDPAFAAREQQAAFKQTSGNVARAASAAGASGVASMAAAGAALGPAGIAVAAADAIKQSFLGAVDTVGRFGAAIASLDADAFVGELTAVAKKLPVFGEALGAVGDAAMGIFQAMDQTAQRLAQYNPELAVSQALVGVRRIMNDIERANRLGPQLAQYVLERQEQKERLEEILTRLSVQLIPIASMMLEKLSVLVEGNLALAQRTGEVHQNMQDSFWQMALVNPSLAVGNEILRRMYRSSQETAANTRPERTHTVDFFDMVFNNRNVPALPRRERPGRPGAANPRERPGVEPP